MANGETTTPATTPDRIDSSSVEFDPTRIDKTLEEKYQFLYDRLFGEYSETIKLPQDITVDEFKEFLKGDWKFRIPNNPALAAELNALAPNIIEDFGEDLYWQVVWASKTIMPADPDPRQHYTRGGPGASLRDHFRDELRSDRSRTSEKLFELPKLTVMFCIGQHEQALRQQCVKSYSEI
jgi:hypothetical protein